MDNRILTLGLAALALIWPATVPAQSPYNGASSASPPKLPLTRSSGRFGAPPAAVRVQPSAGIADTWKPTRREIGSVAAGTMVDVLEDVIVVDAPDVVLVTGPIPGLKLNEFLVACKLVP